jgi:MFS family permease
MNKKEDEYTGVGTKPEEMGVSGGGISLRGLRTFDSFSNPIFRLYFLGMAGQWASMNIQMVARSLLIYRISSSGAILGISALASAIPTLLFSLLGGAIADRVQKKYVLLFSQLGSALVSLGIALCLTLGYLGPQRPGSWWILMVSAAFQGTIMGFMMPSRQAIIAEIVGGEHVMNAVSLNNLGMNTFQIVAPGLAGFIIDAFDFDVIYYTATGLYLMATVCMVLMPRTTSQGLHGSSALTDILNGLRYIGHERTILLVLISILLGTLCRMPFMQLMPMFTEDILKVGATGMGLLMSVSGVGAIIGSLVLASLPNRKRGVIMVLSGLTLGLALAGFSFSHWWYFSLVLVAFVGLGQAGNMTTGNTLIQYYSEPDYRGRVMSFMMMGMGFSNLGTFVAGVMTEAVGVQWSVGGLAIILALASVIMLTVTPRLRELD